MRPRLILGAAIGHSVRVADIVRFLSLARGRGYESAFLGPLVAARELVEAINHYDPQVVLISHHRDPDACRDLLHTLSVADSHRANRTWLFCGTDATAAVARETGLFTACFTGSPRPRELMAAVEGPAPDDGTSVPPQSLLDRMAWKAPHPLIRHHYGQPTLAETLAGVREIAAAQCLDVISLRIDHNAQEHFFRPWEMDPHRHGTDGVPVRSRADLEQIYAQTRTGNFPLLRCYSGTRDRLFWAMVQYETLHSAWLATPLFWYNQLDGRSRLSLRTAIAEAQEVVRWYARRRLPVEMNESHHWSHRRAHDVVAVASTYLAAYNARACGVRDYVQQLMVGNPPDTTPAMDLAKMLAKLELVESLANERFRIWRQTQEGEAGLARDPRDGDALRRSIALQMQVRPHIIHVGGPTAAYRPCDAAAVIASCRQAQAAVERALADHRDLTRQPEVQRRKDELVAEARVLLAAVASLARPGVSDPLTDPDTLASAVEVGLLDAPGLRPHRTAGRRRAAGVPLVTRMIEGACVAVDPATGRPLPEAERVLRLGRRNRRPRRGSANELLKG